MSDAYKLIAPTGHSVVIISIAASEGNYAWTVYDVAQRVLRVGGHVGTLRSVKTRARRDLEIAAYWPAEPSREMRQARWSQLTVSPAQRETLTADQLCERYVELLARQLVDLARPEIERNFAPVRLADNRFGVRVLALREGRIRPDNYYTLSEAEFVALLDSMAEPESERVNGAMVV